MELDDELKTVLEEETVTPSYSAEYVEQAKREAVAEYKKGLALVVFEYHAGCESGKRQFLDELGIQWPYSHYRFDVTVKIRNDVDAAKAVESIMSSVVRDYDTDSIVVNVGSWEPFDDEDY